MARQYAHQWVLTHELKRCGVEIDFVQQLGDSSTPEGQFLLGIQGLFAEYERTQITERLRRGKLYRIREGQLLSPVPPYGYRYLPVSQPDGGRWERDEIETPVDAGEAMPPRGKRWNYSTVQSILKQPAYTGHTHYNRSRREADSKGEPRQRGRGNRTTARRIPRQREEWIAIQTPQLIEQSLWQETQERLAMNQKSASRNNKRHFYLSRTLLVCDICGRTLSGRTAQGHTSYYCTNRGKNRNPDVPPHARSVAGSRIEPLVWEAVTHLLDNPILLADAWQSQEEHVGELDEAERLEERLRKLQRQWSRLLDAFQDEMMSKDELVQRKSCIDSESQSLGERLTRLQRQQQQQQVKQKMLDDFEAYCRKIRSSFHDPIPEVQQEVIRLLIDHIVVSDDSIVIKHIIPTDDDCRLLPSHR